MSNWYRQNVFYLRLLVDTTLSETDRYVWFETVAAAVGNADIDTKYITDDNDKAQPVRMIHRRQDKHHIYEVLLKRHPSDQEVEDVVANWNQAWPSGDFYIEASTAPDFTQHKHNQTRLENDLARFMHNAWMKKKHAAGYRWGPERDDLNRMHPLLADWERLPEQHQHLDKDFVQGMLDIFDHHGYVLVDKNVLEDTRLDEGFDPNAVYLHGGPGQLEGGHFRRGGRKGHDMGGLFFVPEGPDGWHYSAGYAVGRDHPKNPTGVWRVRINLSREQVFDFSNVKHRKLAQQHLSPAEYNSWLNSAGSSGHLDWAHVDEDLMKEWGFQGALFHERSAGVSLPGRKLSNDCVSVAVWDPKHVEKLDFVSKNTVLNWMRTGVHQALNEYDRTIRYTGFWALPGGRKLTPDYDKHMEHHDLVSQHLGLDNNQWDEYRDPDDDVDPEDHEYQLIQMALEQGWVRVGQFNQELLIQFHTQRVSSSAIRTVLRVIPRDIINIFVTDQQEQVLYNGGDIRSAQATLRKYLKENKLG